MTEAPVRRQRDPERTRREILDVATEEFAENGWSGARVDAIAARTRTTKRMLYYYFESKEQLYLAVLERVYARLRDRERHLRLEHLDPLSAVRRLAEHTFDHHEENPTFVKLVSIENLSRGDHLLHVDKMIRMNRPVVDALDDILSRGRAQGLFVRNVDSIDIHMLISAFCFFRVGNRHTFNVSFGRDMLDPLLRERYRRMVGDVVVAYLTTPDGDTRLSLQRA